MAGLAQTHLRQRRSVFAEIASRAHTWIHLLSIPNPPTLDGLRGSFGRPLSTAVWVTTSNLHLPFSRSHASTHLYPRVIPHRSPVPDSMGPATQLCPNLCPPGSSLPLQPREFLWCNSVQNPHGSPTSLVAQRPLGPSLSPLIPPANSSKRKCAR